MMKKVLSLVNIGTILLWCFSLFSNRICYGFCSFPWWASTAEFCYIHHDGPTSSSFRFQDNHRSYGRYKQLRSCSANGRCRYVATTARILLSSGCSDDDNGDKSSDGSMRRTSNIKPTTTSTSEIKQQQQIPVLGPFFNTPPLIIGVSQLLHSPTPIQWKTIEYCIESMAAHDDDDDDEKSKMATVDAAPLVAIVSQHTEIATLAAIVGIASAATTDDKNGKQKQQHDIDDFTESSPSRTPIDTTDSSSLQESLARISRRRISLSSSTSMMYSDNVKIRFLGIGRAKLSGFKSISPSYDITIPIADDGAYNYDQDNDNDEDGEVEEEEEEHILVARVNLILDGPEKRKNENNEQLGHHVPKKISPVHAINELSILASRLNFLHTDRQKLVQGISAAQTRLDCASKEWEDLDGIGNIFHDDDNDECDILTTTTDSISIRDFLAMDMTNYDAFATDYSSSSSDDDDRSRNNILESSVPLSREAFRVSKLENYGLGLSSSAFSSLTSLAQVMTKQLEPYYSPSMIDSEEFHYCMLSWVALQSLSHFYDNFPPHYTMIKSCLECCNTIERMEQLYDDMLSHKHALQEIAQAKRRELLDCGEECTDLF